MPSRNFGRTAAGWEIADFEKRDVRRGFACAAVDECDCFTALYCTKELILHTAVNGTQTVSMKVAVNFNQMVGFRQFWRTDKLRRVFTQYLCHRTVAPVRIKNAEIAVFSDTVAAVNHQQNIPAV